MFRCRTFWWFNMCRWIWSLWNLCFQLINWSISRSNIRSLISNYIN